MIEDFLSFKAMSSGYFCEESTLHVYYFANCENTPVQRQYGHKGQSRVAAQKEIQTIRGSQAP
jgi:hypothetical protein